MATEYRLSYTASEIDEKLGQIDGLSTQVSHLSSDVFDIKSNVIQQNAIFVNSIEECADTTKLYVLPDGYIYAYMMKETQGVSYTNLANPQPENTTDTTKWVKDHRVSLSGIVAQSGKTVTNAVEGLKIGDVVRIKGVDLDDNDRFDMIGTNPYASEVQNQRIKYAESTTAGVATYENIDGVHTFTVLYEYFTLNDISLRFTILTPEDPYSIIITKNEEITEATSDKTYAWTNTGHAFVPADYEDRIIEVENIANQNTSDIIEISSRVTALENGDISEYETVDTVEEMTDTSKQYVLNSTGTLWAYGETTVDDTDRNLYDASACSLNVRVDGTTRAGTFTTDYIPANLSSADPYYMRVKGLLHSGIECPQIYKIAYYDENKTQLISYYENNVLCTDNAEKDITFRLGYGSADDKYANYDSVAYVRIEVKAIGEELTQDNMLTDISITTSEPKTTTSAAWYDTGLAPEASGNGNNAEILAKVNKNAADIAEVSNKVSTLENASGVGLPPYWKDAVDALEGTMRERQSSGADAFQFVLFSDLHGVNGTKNTNGAGTSVVTHIGKVAQYAAEKYNIPLVAIAGDIQSQSSHTSEENVWKEYEAIKDILSPIDKSKLVCTKGNHDGAWGEPVNGVYYLKNIGSNKIYNAIFRGQANDGNRVFGGNGTYFYVDTPQKIRFFVLNSHTDGDGSTDENGLAVYNPMKAFVFGSEQLAWLADALLGLPEGWGAVITTHTSITSASSVSALDRDAIGGLLQAYKNRTTFSKTVSIDNEYWGNGITDATYKQTSVDVDFTEAKGEIIAYFHGHWHQDYTCTAYSTICIGITTAGADVRGDNVNFERVPNTATETALDIVTIDRNAKKIYCTRLGAGADREISY